MVILGEERRLIGPQHERVARDYYARITDSEYPKDRAASLAKKWGFEYWDGDRRVNYGGYHYKEGYWTDFARGLISSYGLTPDSSVLDIGCGKGFLLRELRELLPGIQVVGLDISEYAVANADPTVRESVVVGNAVALPFSDCEFDLAVSLNTFHNLYNYELDAALRELERVAVRKYLVVESYRSETEKMNLLYWQVTCESFCTPQEWKWWFNNSGYMGDYEFIFFA